MSGEAEEPGEKQPTGVRETVQTPANAAVSPVSQGPGTGHKHHSIEFRFLDELKRRNVGRVAILYLVVCWLILEPVHVIFHMLGSFILWAMEKTNCSMSGSRRMAERPNFGKYLRAAWHPSGNHQTSACCNDRPLSAPCCG